MTSNIGRILIGIALALCALICRAEVRLGVDYDLMPKPIASENPGKVEVEELFWYRCSHCFQAQSFIKTWRSKFAKDVVFRPIHIMYPGRSDLEGHARLYLALKGIGALDSMQDKVFSATFEQNLELRDESVLTKWLATQNIPVDKFMAVYKSFGMSAQLAQLQSICLDNNIGHTPTFVVAGKYNVKMKEGLTPEAGMNDMFNTITQLIDKARKEQAGKKK